MVLKTSKAYQLCQGLPDHPEFMPGYFDNTAQEIKALLKKHGVFDMPCGIAILSLLQTLTSHTIGIYSILPVNDHRSKSGKANRLDHGPSPMLNTN